MRPSSGKNPSIATQSETAARWPPMLAAGCCYLCGCPTDLPKLISPLSIRKLKPQSGLLQTQALYVMGAPSLP
jgi:hypothetical protein